MDWDAVTFDWNRARAFLVTAEEGSLSAAARALRLAQPTLGRQVDLLEEELGVALFERVGKRLHLTPAGHDLLIHVRAMGEAARRLSMRAYGENDVMAGEVSISVADNIAACVLPPILAQIMADEPAIRVKIVASNAASDLLHREADIAIRNLRPSEPDLVARRLTDRHARLYAARAYLETLGPIAGPADLGAARFIGIDDTPRLREVLAGMGIPLGRDAFASQCESFLVVWHLIRAGLGIGVMDDAIGDSAADVVRVLPDLTPLTYPVWLVAHRDIHRSARQRYVFDRLAHALSQPRA